MAIFQSNDKLALFYTDTPANTTKATVVFVHGVGEHIIRYRDTFQHFATAGYHCFGYDQRGFGQSQGIPGHIDKFQDYVDDLAKFITTIVTADNTNPVFLFAHSMGTIVALNYALQRPAMLKGLIISSCPWQLAKWYAKYSGIVGRSISISAPYLSLPTFIRPEALTDDPKVINRFKCDSLIRSKVTVSWLREFEQARQALKQRIDEIQLPTLICHGTDDSIAAVSGAHELYYSLTTADKKLILFEGFKHELLNHRLTRRQRVWQSSLNWLDRHC